MMRPFWQLLRKELRESLPTAALFCVALVALYALPHLFPLWDQGLVILLISSPVVFLPFWVMWRSISIWRQEWRGNKTILLLSLPAPGWMLVGSKFLAVLLETFLYLIVVGAGFTIASFALMRMQGPSAMGYATLLAWGLYVDLLLLVLVSIQVLLVQFAYLVSRLATRLRWLAFGAGLIVGGCGLLRVGTLLSPLFQWLPRLPVPTFTFSPSIVTRGMVYIQVTPLAGGLLVLGCVFWLCTRLIERDLEV